jgi:hypothetical protein
MTFHPSEDHLEGYPRQIGKTSVIVPSVPPADPQVSRLGERALGRADLSRRKAPASVRRLCEAALGCKH